MASKAQESKEVPTLVYQEPKYVILEDIDTASVELTGSLISARLTPVQKKDI